jgi:proline iminopeptidase
MMPARTASPMLFFLLLLALASGCKREQFDREGDYFFLRHAGADLPVWVRGNTASGVFLIHLHGGPGGSGITEAEEKAFDGLEDDYAVVYYDQRASGAAQGNALPESITMAQFVEDLHQLVQLIQAKYSNPRLFLLGHSWGGALGTAYLIQDNYQDDFQGWIELDGAHNFSLGVELSRQYIIDYADSMVVKGEDTAYWQEALAWYADHLVINTFDLANHHAEYVHQARGYIYDKDNPDLAYFREGNINSPSGSTSTGTYVQRLMEGELSRSYADSMSKILLPSLVLWGRYDGILPVALAQDAYDHLGTPPADKSIRIFEQSSHSPNREQRLEFLDEVKRFVERYR